MAQESIWEREYRTGKLVTLGTGPSADVRDFFRFVRREQKIDFSAVRALDLGSGVGKNAQGLAEEGATVIGYEISDTALKIARERAAEAGLAIAYEKRNIGAAFPLPDRSIGVILDVMSSNSLDEQGRARYLSECARVLRPGGWMFFRGLCKDGDKNAKELIKRFPGKEKDTYIMPELGLTERVFTKADFEALYGQFFRIERLEQKENYAQVAGRSYKRHYWIAYLTLK